MKNINVTVVTVIFLVGVFARSFSVDSTDHKKGVYYNHVESTGNVEIHSVNGMNIDYSAELKQRGDFYEISFDVVNESGVDMKVEQCSINQDDPFIKYELVYQNGKSIKEGDILLKGERKSLKYRVYYENQIDVSEYKLDSGFILDYGQVI